MCFPEGLENILFTKHFWISYSFTLFISKKKFGKRPYLKEKRFFHQDCVILVKIKGRSNWPSYVHYIKEISRAWRAVVYSSWTYLDQIGVRHFLMKHSYFHPPSFSQDIISSTRLKRLSVPKAVQWVKFLQIQTVLCLPYNWLITIERLPYINWQEW